MFTGNWKCSVCGGAITELPFEPRSEAGLTCRDCFIKRKNSQSETPPENNAVEEMPPVDFTVGELASEAPPPPPPEVDGTTPATPGERKMFSGEWTCAVCGGAITSLPFEPHSSANLKCLDCFKQGKS